MVDDRGWCFAWVNIVSCTRLRSTPCHSVEGVAKLRGAVFLSKLDGKTVGIGHTTPFHIKRCDGTKELVKWRPYTNK